MTLASLTARLDRLEERIEQTDGNRSLHVLYVRPGEDEDEVIERQKRQRGVTDKDKVIVVLFVAPSVRDE